MTRLLCFMSFFPASYALIRIGTSDALLWYLGAYVLGYVGGKGVEYIRPGANVNINNPGETHVSSSTVVEK